MIGEKFLKERQVKDKSTESIFSQFAFNHLQMTQTQKRITHRVSKIHKWIWEHGYEWGKFSRPWQVTDKLLSDFLFTIHIFILRMTQTQEIITRRVLKIHEWIWGDVYEWGKVSWTMICERLNYRLNIFFQFTFNLQPHSKYVIINYHNLC